jgi:hypothetical protein
MGSGHQLEVQMVEKPFEEDLEADPLEGVEASIGLLARTDPEADRREAAAADSGMEKLQCS